MQICGQIKKTSNGGDGFERRSSVVKQIKNISQTSVDLLLLAYLVEVHEQECEIISSLLN